MLTLLSSPSTLLSLASSLHSVAANADWSVPSCEALVTVAHGVGMGYLQSRVAPVVTDLKPLKSCLKRKSGCRSNGSKIARLCSFLRRKAAAKPTEKTLISAMKGSRAAASQARERRGCWLPSRWFASKSVRFNEDVKTKVISRCAIEEWDRDFDRSSKPYARRLGHVQLDLKMKICFVGNYLEPHGHNQLHFPRTHVVRDGRDPELEDDDGDIEMDLS